MQINGLPQPAPHAINQWGIDRNTVGFSLVHARIGIERDAEMQCDHGIDMDHPTLPHSITWKSTIQDAPLHEVCGGREPPPVPLASLPNDQKAYKHGPRAINSSEAYQFSPGVAALEPLFALIKT